MIPIMHVIWVACICCCIIKFVFFSLKIFDNKIFMTAGYLFTSFLRVYLGILLAVGIIDVLPCLTFNMSYVKSFFFLKVNSVASLPQVVESLSWPELLSRAQSQNPNAGVFTYRAPSHHKCKLESQNESKNFISPPLPEGSGMETEAVGFAVGDTKTTAGARPAN